MKKIFTLLFCGVAFSSLCAQTEFTQGGVTYTVTGETSVSIKKSQATGEVVLPENVTEGGKTYDVKSIGREAFKWSSLTSIVLPASLDTIGYNAFGSCSKLTRITLPDNLSVIEPYAFSGCSVLESITLPTGLKAISNNVFFTCYALRSVNIPAGVKYIGSAAFYKTAIETVVVPEGCDSIAKTAFLFCAQLSDLQLPKTLRHLGAAALQGCKKLTTLVVPEKIDSLSDELLMECSGLTSLHFPATLTKLGRSVFAKSGISAFTVAEDHPTFKLIDGAVYTKNQKLLMAFPTRGRKSCEIPEGVIGIWGGAFYGSDIESVKLPESMVAIDESAFAESQLSSINFPKSLIFLGPTALYRTQFKELTLPENNTVLYDGLVAYCPNLESVTIPEKVTFIDSHVFSQNKKLTKITCLGATPPGLYDYYEEDESPFGWITKDAVTLFVPQGTTAAYKATSWNMFRNIQESAAPVLTPSAFMPELDSKLKSITTIDLKFDEPVSFVSGAKAPVLRKGSLDGTPIGVTSKWSVIHSPDDKTKQTVRIVSFDYDGYTEYFTLDPSSHYYMVIPANTIKGTTSGQQNEETVVHYSGTEVTHIETVGEMPKIMVADTQVVLHTGAFADCSVKVYNVTGSCVLTLDHQDGYITLPSLPKGAYVLRIANGEKALTFKYVQP